MCGVGRRVGLGSLSADFGELSGDPRGVLVASLLPSSPGSNAHRPTLVLCQQLPCVRAGGICCRNGPSLSPPAPKNDEVGPFCCCWQSAMLGKRPCSKQALLSWAFPPH